MCFNRYSESLIYDLAFLPFLLFAAWVAECSLYERSSVGEQSTEELTPVELLAKTSERGHKS